LDLWYDEIYTLNSYVLVPLIKTVTYYNAPNNHVFFNLLLNLYLKILNISKLTSILQSPDIIRTLMLLYSLCTIFYFYRIGKMVLNHSSSLLAVVLLVTTIPFVNFSLQIRGYCLSITLLSMLVYHSWQFEISADWKNGLMIVLAAALAIYTLPSNLYFILSLICFYIAYQILRIEKHKRTSLSWLTSLKVAALDYPMRIIYLIGGSILFAIILYSPVIGQVINNPYVVSHGLFRLKTLIQVMPRTFSDFIFGKWWLLPFVVIGLFVGLKSPLKGRFLYYLLFCLTVLTIPFLISFIRGDNPSGRVFVNLSFILVLLLALCLDKFIYSRKIPSSFVKWVILAFIIFSYGGGFWAEKQVDAHIYADIVKGNISQDLLNNYYLEHYSLSKVLSEFASSGYDHSIPVYLVYQGDSLSTKVYIAYYKIKRVGLDDTLKGLVPNSKGEAYVITTFPNKFTKILNQKNPDTECIMLNNLDFVNVFRCQVQKTSGS
jgi:hypothetical protein